MGRYVVRGIDRSIGIQTYRKSKRNLYDTATLITTRSHLMAPAHSFGKRAHEAEFCSSATSSRSLEDAALLRGSGLRV